MILLFHPNFAPFNRVAVYRNHVKSNNYCKMKRTLMLSTVAVTLLCHVAAMAQEHYRFVPTDYVSTDNNRAPQSAFGYDEWSFTISASGQNNVAFKMGAECDSKYFITSLDHWLVVRGSNLKTGTADTYLWWINGVNHGTQVAPDYVSTTPDGQQLFVWNLLNGNELFSWFNNMGERQVLNSNGTGFILAMGLL